MRMFQRLVAVTLTSGALAAWLLTESALRSAEEFTDGVRYGLK